MSALRGLLGGVLTLTLLEAAVSTTAAADNASGLIKIITGGLARIIDPNVALIPDRRKRIEGQGGTPIILAN